MSALPRVFRRISIYCIIISIVFSSAFPPKNIILPIPYFVLVCCSCRLCYSFWKCHYWWNNKWWWIKAMVLVRILSCCCSSNVMLANLLLRLLLQFCQYHQKHCWWCYSLTGEDFTGVTDRIDRYYYYLFIGDTPLENLQASDIITEEQWLQTILSARQDYEPPEASITKESWLRRLIHEYLVGIGVRDNKYNYPIPGLSTAPTTDNLLLSYFIL